MKTLQTPRITQKCIVEKGLVKMQITLLMLCVKICYETTNDYSSHHRVISIFMRVFYVNFIQIHKKANVTQKAYTFLKILIYYFSVFKKS